LPVPVPFAALLLDATVMACFMARLGSASELRLASSAVIPGPSIAAFARNGSRPFSSGKRIFLLGKRFLSDRVPVPSGSELAPSSRAIPRAAQPLFQTEAPNAILGLLLNLSAKAEASILGLQLGFFLDGLGFALRVSNDFLSGLFCGFQRTQYLPVLEEH
jgi:hypothetical protein